MSDLPTSLPMVTIPGVRATSRALYGALGALLAPLVAQALFSFHVEPFAWGLTMALGLVAGGALGGVTVRDGSAARQFFRVLFRAAALGVLAGVVGGNAWVALHEGRAGDLVLAATMFGGYFGLLTGLALGGVFALWAVVARAALLRPSSLASLRLSMIAGMVLSAAGAFGLSVYRIDEMRAFAVGSAVAGALLVVAALVRTARLGKLLRAVDEGSLQVQESHEPSNLPTLAWAANLDGVLARPRVAVAADPSPFRAQSPVESIARMPRDLAAVRREIKRSVGVGFVVLGVLTSLAGASMVRVAMCCPSSAGAPCGGCAH